MNEPILDIQLFNSNKLLILSKYSINLMDIETQQYEIIKSYKRTQMKSMTFVNNSTISVSKDKNILLLDVNSKQVFYFIYQRLFQH